MGLNGTYRNTIVEEILTLSSVDWYGVPYSTVTVTNHNLLDAFSGYTSGGTFFSYNQISSVNLAAMTDVQYETRRNDLLSTITNLRTADKDQLVLDSTGVSYILCPTTTTTTAPPTTTTTTSTTTAPPTTTTTTTAAPTTTTTTVAPYHLYWNILKNTASSSNLKIYLNGALMINKSATTVLQSGNFVINNGDEVIVRNGWASGSGNVSKMRLCDDNGELDYTEADVDTIFVDSTVTVNNTSLYVYSRGGSLNPTPCLI